MTEVKKRIKGNNFQYWSTKKAAKLYRDYQVACIEQNQEPAGFEVWLDMEVEL